MSEMLFYVLKDSCFDIEGLDVTKVNVYDLIVARLQLERVVKF